MADAKTLFDQAKSKVESELRSAGKKVGKDKPLIKT